MLSEMLLFIENLEYIRTIFPLDLLANVSYLWKWKTLWIDILTQIGNVKSMNTSIVYNVYKINYLRPPSRQHWRVVIM